MPRYTLHLISPASDPQQRARDDVVDLTQKRVTDCLDRVLAQYDHFLAAKHYDIGLRIAPGYLPKGLFVVGNTYSPTDVILSLRENLHELMQKYGREVESAIVHELHHLQRLGTVGYGDTLHQSLITEGLACLAEVQHFPDQTMPYIHTTPDEINFLLSLYDKEKNITDYDHDRWFFGSGDLPIWAGYKLGYYLAKNRADSIKKTSWELVDQLVSPGG